MLLKLNKLSQIITSRCGGHCRDGRGRHRCLPPGHIRAPVLRLGHLALAVLGRGPVGVLGQALDLEELGRLEEGGEVTLAHVDLAHVDELEYGVKIHKRDITQKQDRMLPTVNACKR